MSTILLVDDEPLQALDRKSALERRFSDVQRVADAAEALCLIEQPEFARRVGLVIASHHAAGFGGPEFVAELHFRLPALRILVIGGVGETLGDYRGIPVYFLSAHASLDDLVAAAGLLLHDCRRTAA
jgi:CheY-like chemotaxis protein